MNEQISYQIEAGKKFLSEVGYCADIEKIPDEEIQEKLESLLSLSLLDNKEIAVLSQRKGFQDGRKHTLQEIGNQFHLTRERIRQIEAKAIRKLTHSKEFDKREKIKNRLRKLIPTLEYDVLYEAKFFEVEIRRKIGYNINYALRGLLKGLDLAEIGRHYRGKRYFRIGEQDENLPILEEPIKIPSYKDYDIICSKDYFKKTWIESWKNLVKAIQNTGYTEMTDTLLDDYWFARHIFRDFIAENELPVAINQAYRLRRREPVIVYHPRIIRQVRDEKTT